MKLIINADDLGYTPVINQAIFNLHSRERVSSTSLLVNMPHSQAVIEGLGSFPDLAVGAHLNLTKGVPLSPPETIPSLVSPGDTFWPTRNFFLRAVSRTDITLELVAYPGLLHDPNFPADTLLTHQRQWEVDFLLSSRFDEWLNLMDAEILGTDWHY